MRPGKDVTNYIFLSISAAVLLLIVSLVGPIDDTVLDAGERWLVVLGFISCCIFGILMSMKPGLCRPGRKTSKGTYSIDSQNPGRRLIGHHPDCSSFDGHVIVMGRRRYCSGCIGLAIGSFIAGVAMFTLSFMQWPSQSIGTPLLLLGLALVSFCLAETAYHLRNAVIHVAMNAFLVIGFLLAVVGVTAATQNGGYGLVAVIVCLLWMDTRIHISDWKHARVCDVCPQGCKSY